MMRVWLILIAIALSACGMTYSYNGRTFDSAAAALAYQQTVLEKGINETAVLPEPIAESLVVITNTRDQMARMIKADFPHAPPEHVDYLVESAIAGDQLLSRMIVQANIFKAVFDKRLDHVSAGDINGSPYQYMIWSVRPDRTRAETYIIARGETTPSLLYSTSMRRPEKGDFIRDVVSYVRAHPARP